MVKSTEIGDDIVLIGIIASSVTFALTTVICFIIGFISGRVCTNFTNCGKLLRGESVNSNITNNSLTTNPVYDNIMPQEMGPQQNNFELQENVAYTAINIINGTVQLIILADSRYMHMLIF